MTLLATPAVAEPNIQALATPQGMGVWLVESPALPMVAVEVAFRAGSSFDTPERTGLANLTASLFDEGAGNYDATAFNEELEKIGARLYVSADRTDSSLMLYALPEHLPRSLELLGLALTKPRFDEDAVERVKESILAGIKRAEESPGSVAGNLFSPAVFGAHPYGRRVEGTAESVKNISANNVKVFHQQHYTKANMVVSVVGAVSSPTLLPLLDKALGALPKGEKINTIAVAPDAPALNTIKKQMNVPQANILIGRLGITRDDPDYYAAVVMNDILGGGGFRSRLMEEVREKRGLAYSVYSAMQPLPLAGLFMIGVQTNNTDAPKTIALIREELQKMASKGISSAELKASKDYLIGSFPLRLESNRKILDHLSMMQLENLPITYLNDWPEKVAAVKAEDVARMARRYLDPNTMVTIIVGDGKAVE